jgi:hypothetical protein
MKSSSSTDQDNETNISHSESQNLNILIKDLLVQMQSKLRDSENSIVGRLDVMGEHLDGLEQSECKLP